VIPEWIVASIDSGAIETELAEHEMFMPYTPIMDRKVLLIWE
jgi:hypothetical protein